MTPPKTIEYLSAGNVIEFRSTLKPTGKSELHYIYEYTKSITKKGMLLGLTESELLKLIKVNEK